MDQYHNQSPTPADSITSHLMRHVKTKPGKSFLRLALPGLVDDISYGRAWQDIERCKNHFDRSGVRRGETVLIFLPQSWQAIAYYLGAIAYGCIASFMPCATPKQDPDTYWAAHLKLLSRTQPAALVSDSSHAPAMVRNGLLGSGAVLLVAEDLQERPPIEAPVSEWNDVLPMPILQHSSGTTGLKKGVMLSHESILAQVDAYARSIDAREDDIVVSWLPLYHDMGLVACLLMPMILGQTIVLLDPFHWVARPATLFKAISSHRGTLCWMPNFAFDHLSRTVEPKSDMIRLDSMRAFINCSEPCHAETFRRFYDKFQSAGLSATALQVCYAMAETTFAVAQTSPGQPYREILVDREALYHRGRVAAAKDKQSELRLISVGRALEGTEIIIRGSDGGPVEDGTVGEVCVHSTSLCNGYYRLPDETDRRFSAGLYATRDRGFLLAGELFVLGRLDDLIIVAGRNFHAAEIEILLNQIVGLKAGRAIAFGVANADRGTADLILVAELSDEAASQDDIARQGLSRRVREAIFQALNLYPTEVLLVQQGWLHKTTSGKIERTANVERFLRERAERDIGDRTGG